MPAIVVGDEAPDFELPDQTRRPVRLSDYRGKKAVLLVFYPFSFTDVCRSELCSIRDRIDVFRSDDVETIAVSVDSAPVHRAWADANGFEFPVLADFWPHGEVARTYGVFDDRVGAARRATFLVDAAGRVVYTDAASLGEARDPEAWREALTALVDAAA